jgi:2'-5' RNA ligase
MVGRSTEHYLVPQRLHSRRLVMTPSWKRSFDHLAPNYDRVTVMLTLPESLAAQFPKDRGGDDDSVPHVTVLYVGSVDPAQADGMIEVIKRVCARHKPFDVYLGPVTYFSKGDHGYPAVLKIHSDGLRSLQSNLKSSLLHAGYSLDDKWPIYKPHTTLQYVSEEGGYNGSVPQGSWKADSIDLYGLERRIPLGLEKTVDNPLPSWKAAFETVVGERCDPRGDYNRTDL